MSGLVAAEIKKILGTPFLITFHALGRVRRLHQGTEDAFPDIRFEIEDRVVREADHIIAECPQDEHDLLNLYQADPGKISVIPCGFDPHELWVQDKSYSRQLLGLPQDEFIILQLGRMVPRKGVDTAIRGFAKLVNRHQIPARLVVVGGESRNPDPKLTPEIGRLQDIARQEGVFERVTFTGRRNRQEIIHYYNAADVFVSTPWYEPFGITPVEAMACGVPVIGSNVGGIKYTVVHGQTGYLISPNDPDSLGQKLAYLYRHPGQLAQYSRNSIDRANELFTWKKVSELIAETFEGVLAQPEFTQAEADQMALIHAGMDMAIQTLLQSRQFLSRGILATAQLIVDCLKQGGKIMVIGNGGSAADAQHFAAEFVGRFVYPGRPGLPVMALTADSAFLTAWANDIGYTQVFARQVETFGEPGDLLIGISTSGRSQNVIEAFKTAQDVGIGCVSIVGGDGGELLPLSDQAIVVPADNTQRIQEIHILILHLLCELVEAKFIPIELAPEPFASLSMRSISSTKNPNERPASLAKVYTNRNDPLMVAGNSTSFPTWKFFSPKQSSMKRRKRFNHKK
jgi:phosphoheptose isomerase